MKDLVQENRATLTVDAHSFPKANPRAVSVRLEARSMSKAKGTRNHDYRLGKVPDYVNRDLSHLNRKLCELRPLFQIRNENAELRRRAGRQRAMKSNAAVVTAGIITFGTEAARMFEALEPQAQDAAFKELANTIAATLDTALESLIVHLDETTIHAHFTLRGYSEAGLALSDTMKAGTMSELQDIAADVMAQHCPGIERGHRKRDRLAAGARYADTLHRSVRQLHEDLPREIAAREAEMESLELRALELRASMVKTQAIIDKLNATVALSEKEAKRLQIYAVRLQKKEEELAAVEFALEAKRQRVEADSKAVDETSAQLRAEATVLDSERVNLQRAEQEAAKATQIARERRERAGKREAAADKKEVEFEAAIGAFESLLGEIETESMRVNANNKINLDNLAVLRAVPKPLLDRLMPPMHRLVRMIDKTGKKAAFVDGMMTRVNAFLRRKDLAADARSEGETLRREWEPE
ncbi:plasmid recombination protein [Thioclava sp.]|uniref:plasmid recombination protein n=1 Tax=Thioclava sp. TaxID=1933450 RepID=UPI003AA9D566